MIETFKTSFSLRNTYKVNSIIYSLQSIPFLKKIMPSTVYSNQSLKKFANIVAILLEVGSVFIGKIIYVLLMITGMSLLMKSGKAESFFHILIFLTLIGAIVNTHMFMPHKDKYYAIFLMRMDAKTYTLANYYYFLLKTVVGFLPVLLVFGRLVQISYFTCILMTIFILAVKVDAVAFTLYDYKKHGKPKNENKQGALMVVIIVLLLTGAYLFPYLGIAISESLFLIVCGFACIISVFAFRYMRKFSQYKQMYKEILTPESIMPYNKQNVAGMRQKASLKKVETDVTLTSQKSGYAYFNEIFIKRHNRILTRAAKRITLAVVLLFVAVVIACFLNQEFSQVMNRAMLTFLPYFLFVMYVLNRGKGSTEAMFMNCDHSMLSYRFYRQPSAILNLFVLRLKSVVWINLMPALAIALALPMILFITGGTGEFLNYVVLFVSILVMSVFFSVHNMVLYYLLQPYNSNIEAKSAAYTIISTVTYFICYFAIGKRMDTLLFGIAVTVFCILYIMIALVLIYRFASKTFKLRQ